MESIDAIRKENLTRVIGDSGGGNAVAKLMGYKNGAFLSDMTRPDGKRKVSESTCRKVESALNLPNGALSIPLDALGMPPKAMHNQKHPDDLSALILLIGRKLGDTPVSAEKFAILVQLCLLDRSEAHIDQLISLIK